MAVKLRSQNSAQRTIQTSSQQDSPFARRSGTSESFLDVQWRQKRQINRAEATRLLSGHREAFRANLEAHIQDVLKGSLGSALEELAVRWGLAWADLARMVGVSVPALRKWRSTGNASGENIRRVAEVVSFIRVLHEVGVEEPASWLSVPCVPGYTATPRHLYARETSAVLLDMASSTIDPVSVLDEVDSSWREKYSSNFEIVLDEDGDAAIVDKDRANG